ncbi:hypothetical protein CPC08DRAFT_708035 [Agrocybe pediades]|nr:hypothetical protein CPC08DRAFT_708035 [Agrocybe pediades]
MPSTAMDFAMKSSNADTGYLLGNVVPSSSGYVVNGASIANDLRVEYNPSWASRSKLRIRSSQLEGYPNLGLVQFAATSGVTLGAGLSNGLRVTGVADPGSEPGSIPVYLPSYGHSGGTLAAETDVWIIDAAVKRLSVQWVNPDGSTPMTYLITNGVDLAVTGDVAAFNEKFGPGWFTTTLSYMTSIN